MNTMNIPYAERLWYTLRQHGYEVNVQKGGYTAYVGAPDSPAVCIMDGDGNYQMCRSPKIGCVEQLCMMEGIQNVYWMVKDAALNPLHLPGLAALDVETEGNFNDGKQIMMNRHCPFDTAAPTMCGLHFHGSIAESDVIAKLLDMLISAPSSTLLVKKITPDTDDDDDSSDEAYGGE